MKPRKKFKCKTTINNKEYKIYTRDEFVPYFEEGAKIYGNKFKYQIRSYRTWKHYRKHQWKEK